MDVVLALGGIGSAFGLSTSAGLNAYIPLLVVALAAHFPVNEPLLKLSEPYDLLGSTWVILVLLILLTIEMLVDKVPAVDSLNDIIQTFIRPAAGAVLFAANAHVITDISPVLALLAGLLLAGGVHTVKGVVRPAVTASTAGTGNWLVSLVEDIIAFFVSVFSLLLPILAALGLMVLFTLLFIFWRRRRQRQTMAFGK
ncbi:MAG: DUF4126 domain-containing protein [Ardenticatenaceae bacterium]|nr:DUF4126 domain-containing protein [Anaerolineales bacterium]MCB8918746.1 DUF4126 domain-containing protein [Ardenticatenaceae bacterium]